jgi:hypothetical protein
LIYNNYYNQNILNTAYQNYLNSLQNQITNNNKSQTQSSNSSIASSIVNGVATLATGIASAILFTTLFSSVASLQGQVSSEAVFTEDLSERLSALTARVQQLETQVRHLQEDVQQPNSGLLFRCANLNRNTFNGDFFLYGTLQQSNVNPSINNVISSNTIFYSNVQVIGLLFDRFQRVTDLIQF